MPPIYNSRDEAYKQPFGAVKSGQEVRFVLRVPTHYGCETPYLFLQRDGEEARQIPLEKTGTEGDRDIFALTLAAGDIGLYWYWFDLWKDYRKLYAQPSGVAYETTGEGQKYQLTVYDPAFTTPKSVHGGVMYQIFPDRFFEGNPGKEYVYDERIYRADKSKEPYYWPDTQENGFLTWDYFGGDLEGIRQKLPYLVSLGVNWLYLNPIFEAHANHRYNTADYMNIDPYLGTNEDFVRLCADAKKVGIRIMLDGVFSHVGADSIYFNKMGRYPEVGAWQSEQSKYRDWFEWNPAEKCGYNCWWGFETLPHCNKDNRSFRDFICGEGGVIDTWMQRGASGFRLDVADELPDSFIEEIRTAVKRHGSESFLIGEVWEDASHKEAYHVRRRYLLGHELDAVMNYPFRDAILKFLKDFDALALRDSVLAICENYPPPALHVLTNHLSTHDTVRAITALAGEELGEHGRDWQSSRRLTPDAYHLGIVRMQLACVLQYTLPGVPCVYYGDEIAMQGYKDPFNRAYFDWDAKEERLREELRALCSLRGRNPVFKTGALYFTRAESGVLCYERRDETGAVAVGINCSPLPVQATLLGKDVTLPVMGYAIEEGR